MTAEVSRQSSLVPIAERLPGTRKREALRMSSLVAVENARKLYTTPRWGRRPEGTSVKGVAEASLEIRRGETVGLVGESGSGKSTLGRLVLGLEKPDSGEIGYKGVSISKMTRRQSVAFRRSVQPVFQDPSASLNPRRSVRQIVGDAMLRYRMVARREIEAAVVEQLERVGLVPARKYLDRLPSQLSGGQQQRIAIARAFCIRPELVVADEALSSLDHSVQAEVLELMAELKSETGVSYLFISHDIRVTRAFCDQVHVMKDAEIIESGPAAEILAHPNHDYTRRLIAASY